MHSYGNAPTSFTPNFGHAENRETTCHSFVKREEFERRKFTTYRIGIFDRSIRCLRICIWNQVREMFDCRNRHFYRDSSYIDRILGLENRSDTLHWITTRSCNSRSKLTSDGFVALGFTVVPVISDAPVTAYALPIVDLASPSVLRAGLTVSGVITFRDRIVEIHCRFQVENSYLPLATQKRMVMAINNKCDCIFSPVL